MYFIVLFYVYLQKNLKADHNENNWVKMDVYKKLESTLKEALAHNSDSAKELRDANLKLAQAQDLIKSLKLELTKLKTENQKLKDKLSSQSMGNANESTNNHKSLSVSNLLTNVSVDTALLTG